MYDRQSYEVDGKRRFWGGLVLGTVGGGKGLINQHAMAARKSGIGVRYGSAVRSLLGDGREGVRGVVCEEDGELHEIGAGAVVLAGGGFESDARMRAQYLGPNWDVAKVRGTPYNTGEVLMSAIEAGAQPYGNWSGCHSIAWDAAAPPTGDRELTNLLSKQSYPLGIVVNGEARRRWNTSFSPLEVGKHWCYGELAKVAPVHTVPGYVTKTLRDAAGLHKSGAKLSDRWDTHCVDAFVLANAAVGGSGRPTSTQMLHVVPLQFHRRQLHRFTLDKGGQRTPYGGTRSLGLKRGSWVTHPRYGLGFVGGTLHGRMSLHSMETGKRLTQHARVEECRMLCTASWRIRSGLSPGSGVSPIVGAPPRAEGPGFPRVKARAL
jgi:hypothetical protein